MAHQYISLGSACNAAKIMQLAGLRTASYPFDWLLNVDDGLKAVTSMMKNDFQEVICPQSYDVVYHAPVQAHVPNYKSYPRTFHIHTNPAANLNDHDEIVRRFRRFQNVLESSDHLHFVYYRNLTACREQEPKLSASEVLVKMTNEAKDFLSELPKARNEKTYFLLVLESSVEDYDEVKKALASHSFDKRKMSFGQAISRYDDDRELYRKWRQQWTREIVDKTHMPLFLRSKFLIKRAAHGLKSRLAFQLPMARTVTDTPAAAFWNGPEVKSNVPRDTIT